MVDEGTAQTRVATADSAARPWLAQYPQGVPTTLTYPEKTMPQILSETAARYPERTAAAFFDASMSYADLDRLVTRFASRLAALGLRKGDRVMMILPNIPQFPIGYFGILRAGGVVAAINPLLVAREIEQLVRDAEAKIVIVLDSFLDKVIGLRESGVVQHVIVASADEYMSDAMRTRLHVAAAQPIAEDDSLPAIPRFRTFVEEVDGDPPPIETHPDDTAAFQYTGGTTGLPKAAMLTHRNLIANIVQTRAWLATDWNADGQMVILSIMPLYHAYGAMFCMNFAVLVGAKQVLIPRYEIGQVLAAIAAIGRPSSRGCR